MSHSLAASSLRRLASRAGLSVAVNANGSIRRMQCADTTLNLFVGNELEGGPANLYLRSHGDRLQWTVLLGPRSPTQFGFAGNAMVGSGLWCGIKYTVTLALADGAAAWFWHVSLENLDRAPRELDLIYAQDVALAPYSAVRLNEYYVSQYVDHTPLSHTARGCVVASRQNLAASARHPWCVIGSLRRGRSFATDASQVHGLASRAGAAPAGIEGGLPNRRLQHEHSMVAIQDERLSLPAQARRALGFFGAYVADHPAASSPADLAAVDAALALPEAMPAHAEIPTAKTPVASTLFSHALLLETHDPEPNELDALFGRERRHEESDRDGRLLSFFYGVDRHVVLRSKELRVQRPHGHLLRTGRSATPDETALTSTAWMSGVFNSMLTQGHVSINRFLSTVHGYLGLFRTHGQRVFVEIDGAWRLLDVPTAFDMSPDECRWIYQHTGGVIEVRNRARDDSNALRLEISVRSGPPARFLVSHHVALNGDDGDISGSARWWRDEEGIAIAPVETSELGRHWPGGCFRIFAMPGTAIEQVGGDELLFIDGQSRQQPFLCVVTAPANSVGLCLRGQLVSNGVDVPDRATPEKAQYALAQTLRITPPAAGPLADHVTRLAEIVPWYIHDATIHYLSPRGLEQYSGGGWGTRDVSQGPVEMLLAFGRTTPVRDLLLRVLRAQNNDGDWPQWFTFFERERAIRASDSHGDIVYWPILALAQYLIASGDAALLDEEVRFFDPAGADHGECATVWQHVERALALIERRVVAGTALAAYGHGDWNDALQPMDPSMREHMCSAWTVTLHHQTLATLARALTALGRGEEAARFKTWAEAVRRDFRRLLLVDGVLAGYALFDDDGSIRYLLHPRDDATGVRYSALAMVHAILEGLLTPDQAHAHLRLIETHLSGPDGLRLFDRPLPYHGGPQRLFQRAESAAFFGREIGLMYMHAHLRYAQALAHVGDADCFFRALCQANPIGIRDIVPSATLRQANCYYSSSDAAFADRYQAAARYDRVKQGTIALDGGWRVYSSGAGIALSLIVRRFLGLSLESDALHIDPVMPVALNGLRVEITLFGRTLDVLYDVKGSGCGVSAIRMNGKLLPLTRERNPYRLGAARLRLQTLMEQLAQRRVMVMTVDVGEERLAVGG